MTPYIHFVGVVWILMYSGPHLPTTTQKNIVKMEIYENPRKPEDQEVERGGWGGNLNLKGAAFS